MSKDMCRIDLLREITALEFTVIELNLYLDTHPGDREALNRFNRTVMELRALKEAYDRDYGMLTPDSRSSCPWEWLRGPWPWQYEANYRL